MELFPQLESRDIDLLLSHSRYFHTSKRKILIQGGTLDKKVIILMKGMIRGYFINKNGEEKNIFLRPDLTITAAPECLFMNEKTKYTFEALSDSKYIEIDGDSFFEISENNSSIRQLWIEAMQSTILTLIWRVESFVDKTPEQRYEDLLKRSPSFFQTAYNKHIANYLGMTSVSLSRIIKRKSEK